MQHVLGHKRGEANKAQFSLLLLRQYSALSVPSLRDPSPLRAVPQLLCQILGQLIFTTQPLLRGNMSKFVSSPYLWCVICARPHTKKSKPTALQDLPISLLTQHPFSTSVWGPFGTPLWCASHAPCSQMLHLKDDLYSLLVSVLLCEITETILSLVAVPTIFSCTLLLPVRAGEYHPTCWQLLQDFCTVNKLHCWSASSFLQVIDHTN